MWLAWVEVDMNVMIGCAVARGRETGAVVPLRRFVAAARRDFWRIVLWHV